MAETPQGEPGEGPAFPRPPALDPRVVRIFPGSDPVFRAAVLAAVARLDGREPAPGEALATALRHDYPAVRVIEQDPLGADVEPLRVYVFRDDSLVPQPGDGPGATRYISPLVAAQRTSVRSLVARQRSTQLRATTGNAIGRSRRLRSVPTPRDDDMARSSRGTIIEYPLNPKRDRLADWLDEATIGRQEALKELRSTPDGYRDWTEWESWLVVEDDRRAAVRDEWSDPRPWAPPTEDD